MRGTVLLALKLAVIIGCLNGVLAFDVADNTGIADFFEYVVNFYKQYFDSKIKRLYSSAQSQIQGLHASLTNQIQKVAENHEPVLTNSNVLDFLQNLQTIFDDGCTAVNVTTYNILDYFDSFRDVITKSKADLYKTVRTSLSKKLSSCYVSNNLKYTIAVIGGFYEFIRCYFSNYDPVITQASSTLSSNLNVIQSAINVYSFQFFPCRSTAITDEQALVCVSDVINKSPNLTQYMNDALNALSLSSLSIFDVCRKANNTVIQDAVTAYQNCLTT